MTKSRTYRFLKIQSSLAGLAFLVAIPQALSYSYGYGYNGYGWNYLPYSVGYLPYSLLGGLPYAFSNLLRYPLRNAYYSPVGYLPYGGNLPPYAQQTVSYANRGTYSGGGSPMYQQQYSDPEPITDPRQRTRPYRSGQYTNDQTSYARWNNQTAPSPQQAGAAPASAPPIAPQRIKKSRHSHGSSAAPSAVSSNGSPGSAPFAAGFVSTVNDKFDGDISKALFDPSTRGWAKTLGLTHEDKMFDMDLSENRVEVVRKIFRDQTLDPQSKINAVRILINSGPVASNGSTN